MAEFLSWCSIFFQNLVFTSETSRCNDPEGHCISSPPFENPEPHIERLVTILDIGSIVVPHTYYCVFMILNTGQRPCVIFCGKCASPAGKNVPIIYVVWIDQQEYALTFYSLAVTLCTTWYKIQKFYVMHTLCLCVLNGSQNKPTYVLYVINRLVFFYN